MFLSPDDHDITVNWKENTNFLMFLMFLHFTEAATSICLLKKVFTTRRQKALDFFQWLWLLIIINFIIEQLFAEHAWLLLTSRLYSEFDSCSVTIKFACCRRENKLQNVALGKQLFLAWSVKWWVSLKFWNNHSRDWIKNFPQ